MNDEPTAEALAVSREGNIKTECSEDSGQDNYPESSNHKTHHKSLELDADMREKLNEFPEVLEFIEKLQNIIHKQIKKIVKWKRKVRQLSEKTFRNVSIQTNFGHDMGEVHTNVKNDSKYKTSDQNEKSLTDDIREAAEQAMQSSGFVYEETSGLYYDYSSGYYYNAEYGLYYDGTTGIYYKYNQETESYEYHSQVTTSEIPVSEIPVSETANEQRRKRISKSDMKAKVNSFYNMETLTSTFSNMNITNPRSVASDLCKQWPPCMRMIVESTEIPKIKVGSLFIITCDGGTIGREDNHSICLPDINVSKHHLKVSYNTDTSKYVIVDLGSRNGTIINGKRMSISKRESDPFEVPHGSKLQLGSTTLLCHIHEGTQTCGHCEPGLLIEEEKDSSLILSNKRSKNQQFKSELRRLRKQHGLVGSTEDPSKLGEGYTDRAQKRRSEVGSQNPYEKTQSASVDTSIPSENKGFKLLSKMGWKEGQSLGKDGTGVKEPVKVVSNVGTSGIGATTEPSVPENANRTKQTIWKKTQERFDQLPSKCVFDDD